MEKIVIKPEAKEIVLRGKPEDGHVDVFSYNYEGNSSNGLGGLFIVGQVNPASEDTSYMINLVASLAKREYYKTETDPKEAFSKTLKKINEVLQDFFKNKDLSVNIGIFAVTGENIYISRLGKFKIFLARDNQNIDILNNINLFNKEHIQEKEFSNVISGKIIPKDKIFAFYAGRSITARERNIKDNFLKLGADGFSEKLNSIKEANENFTCAAIHLTINKHKESAIIETPQPRELRKSEEPAVTPQLAVSKTPKTSAKVTTPKTLPDIRPVQTIKPEVIKTEAVANPSEKSNVFYPGKSNLSIEPEPAPEPSLPAGGESPMIRPSEFSSAKKDNLFDNILKKFKPSGIYIIGAQQGPVFSKKKIITVASLLAVIVLVVVAKFTFAPYLPIPVPGAATPEEKAANKLADEAKAGLETANGYISQNNLFEARKLLRTYIGSLSAETDKTQRVMNVEAEILAKLDEIDKAVAISPSLSADKQAESPDDPFKLWTFVWSLAKTDLNVTEPDIAGVLGLYPSQDNLYILASDGIYKIVDGLKGKSSAVSWLGKDASLPINPVSIATDN
jgi:hypothetical protein